MTTKQLNKIRTEVFKMCLDSMPESERNSFNCTGTAYLWEIEGNDNKARLWTDYKTQMNFSLLENLGFDREAKITLLVKLDKQTKCADIFSLC